MEEKANQSNIVIKKQNKLDYPRQTNGRENTTGTERIKPFETRPGFIY